MLVNMVRKPAALTSFVLTCFRVFIIGVIKVVLSFRHHVDLLFKIVCFRLRAYQAGLENKV